MSRHQHFTHRMASNDPCQMPRLGTGPNQPPSPTVLVPDHRRKHLTLDTNFSLHPIRGESCVRWEQDSGYYGSCASSGSYAPAACTCKEQDDEEQDNYQPAYRCEQPRCPTERGFGTAGGLLRHEKQVHGLHDAASLRLLCPYPTCKRHTGKAFTRKSNLEEHIRRVHKASPLTSGNAPTSVID
jgi:hypothetical protein